MITLRALQHALLSLLLQFLFFPIWWYTAGARKIMVLAATEIESIFKSFNIPTLFKFLFTPMFGFRDPASRLISLVVRSVHFVIMLLLSIIASLFWVFVLFFWVMLPVITVYQYWFHFFS